MLPTQTTPWQDLLTVVLIGYLLAGAGTWPICAVLVRGYRRRIAHGMRPLRESTSDPLRDALDAGEPPIPYGTAIRHIAIRDAAAVERDHPLAEQARRRSQHLQRIFVGLGLCFGVVSWWVFQLVDPEQRHPLRFLAYGLLGSWLIIPTVLALSSRPGRSRWLPWLGFVVIIIPVLVVARVGDPRLPLPWRPLSELIPAVLLPLVFVAATGRRSLRGAAWFVAPLLMMVGVVLAAGWMIIYRYLKPGRPFDEYAWGALGLAVAVPLLGAALIGTVGHLYREKWFGEQTLLIMQWWLVQALWWALLVSTPGLLGAYVGMLPYAVLLTGLVLALGRAGRPQEPPVRLLLLRTFGARERSSRLLHDLTRQWRWIGSVELITAPDLAGETLEPDEFLDFLRGRLARRFVRNGVDLDDRLANLDLRADRNGRYRVNELMCSADTWQPALERLAVATDVILLDLRGFTAAHPGVDHEIRRVVALQPLARVVAIVDASTDQPTLRASLDRAAALAPASSPLHDDPDPALWVIGWGWTRTDPDRLMSMLVRAAVAH